MTNEEFLELWIEDALEEVYETMDDSWRHGVNKYTVFKDETGRFWGVSYRVSGDGEFHGIRENEFHITEVKPIKKMVEVIEWIPI